MKSIFYKVFGTISVLCLILVASCKKSDNDNDNGLNLGNSTMTMSVNGKAWKAKMAFMMSVPPEESDDDFHFVSISGTEVNINSGDSFEDTEGLNIYIAVPKAKFRAPKGNYNFTSEDDVGIVHQAFAMYIHSYDEEGVDIYSTVGSGSTLGSLKIDDFKIGKQSLYGVAGEYETYTQLSGTFSMTLTQATGEEGQTPEILNITNGKFDVNSGLNLGNFFGTYSEIKEKIQLD